MIPKKNSPVPKTSSGAKPLASPSDGYVMETLIVWMVQTKTALCTTAHPPSHARTTSSDATTGGASIRSGCVTTIMIVETGPMNLKTAVRISFLKF